MNIEEAVNRYLELKPCKNWIESIEPSFFFEFAETVITAYEKEKEKNKRIKDILQKYEHTQVGDEDKILEFYKELKETFI